jgi:copper(I)-binding protein
LAPNGVHLMMFGVKTELRKWDTFPLTLTFRQSGSVDVDVLVEDIVGQ